MSNKVKRNDPCPCGSGKKFKNCCLAKGDNVYSFPGQEFSQDNFTRYQQFVENWDNSQGPPPSFMQFLGKANAASDFLDTVQASDGSRSFESVEELEKVMQARADEQNNTPVNDFLGLTPHQMYNLTYHNFSSNSDIVEFSESVDDKLIRNVPLVAEALWLLKKLAEDEKGRKATQKGNLPRALVHEFFYEFNTDERLLRHLPQGEEDCYGIVIAKLLLKDFGLIKFRNKYYSITKKGRDMLQNTDYFPLYKDIFIWRAEKLNWLYYTRYPDAAAFVQDTLIFDLLILYKKAGVFVKGEELSNVYRTAFPHIEDYELPQLHGYDGLFLNRFCGELGLLERNKDGLDEHESIFDSNYKTTELFHKLFVWHV